MPQKKKIHLKSDKDLTRDKAFLAELGLCGRPWVKVVEQTEEVTCEQCKNLIEERLKQGVQK